MIMSHEEVMRREVQRWKQRPPWGMDGNETSMVQYQGKLFIRNLSRNVSSGSDIARAGFKWLLAEGTWTRHRSRQTSYLTVTSHTWRLVHQRKGQATAGECVGKHGLNFGNFLRRKQCIAMHLFTRLVYYHSIPKHRFKYRKNYIWITTSCD